MSTKRNANCIDDEKNSTVDHAKRWAEYREKAGKALKEKVVPLKTTSKAKYAKFIYTRLVEYDPKKKLYIALEPKQYVELMTELEYENVVDRIWKYYGPKHKYSPDEYTLNVILGLKGPIIFTTDALDNKKDLFVEFEKKAYKHVEHGEYARSDCPTVAYNSDRRSSHSVARVPEINLKSVFPKITPKAIKEAAKIVTTEFAVETGKVKRFVRNGEGWAWMQSFEIKFAKGELLSSGSFRDAYNIQVLEFGELPIKEYVLKTWNKDAIECHKSELECGSDANAAEDLTRRSVQCQMVAQGLAEATASDSYGEKLRYITSYLLETKDGVVSLEPKIHGKFVKYFNNTMDVVLNDDTGSKAASLAHFSFNYTRMAYICFVSEFCVCSNST